MNMEVVKILIAGRGGVGKTTMVNYLNEQTFIPAPITIGIDFHVKEFNLFNHPVTASIFDLGGVQRFDFLRPEFYVGLNCLILACDLTRYLTIEDLDSFLVEARELGINPEQILLVGCKSDLREKRCIEPSDLHSLRETFGLEAVIETSGRSGTNIEIVFQLAAAVALKSRKIIDERQYEEFKEHLLENMDEVEDLEKFKAHKRCFICERALNLGEIIQANPYSDKEQLKELWKSPHVQFFCCSCYKRVRKNKHSVLAQDRFY